MRILTAIKKYKVLIFFSCFILTLVFMGIKTVSGNKSQKVSIGIKGNKLGTLTQEQKLEDFNYMYYLLKDSYPYFQIKERMLGIDWLSKKSEFEDMIKATTNNSEFYFAMDSILTMLQNGHTHIISPGSFSSFYNTYKSSPSTPWKKVLYDKKVLDYYEAWDSQLAYSAFYLPISFQYVDGQYIAFAVRKTPGAEKLDSLIGSTLLKINDVEVDEYIKSLIAKEYLSYDFNKRKLKLKVLTPSAEDSKPIKLSLKTIDDKIIEKELKPLSYNYTPADNTKSESNIKTEIIELNKTAYISIKSFRLENIDEDEAAIRSFWYEIKNYKSLIIDVRGNRGGSYEYWMNHIIGELSSSTHEMDTILAFKEGKYIEPFLQYALNSSDLKGIPQSEVLKHSKTPQELKSFKHFVESSIVVEPYRTIGFKGKVYILTDDNVYSSAEAFCTFAQQTEWATLIGTTTGGDGIGYDPVYAALPNSGLILRFPFDMGLNPDGSANEEYHTAPNIYVEQSYEDFIKYLKQSQTSPSSTSFKPYDTVLNKALEIISHEN